LKVKETAGTQRFRKAVRINMKEKKKSGNAGVRVCVDSQLRKLGRGVGAKKRK